MGFGFAFALHLPGAGIDHSAGVNWGPPSEEVEFDFPDGEEVCRCRRVNEVRRPWCEVCVGIL